MAYRDPRGAHPEHIKRHLGHSSITVTIDLYGYLFSSEQDSIAERLDQMMRESLTDKGRTKLAGRPPKDTEDTPPQAPDQGVFEWARQDLNLQPTDYESAVIANHYKGRPAIFEIWCASGARSTTNLRKTKLSVETTRQGNARLGAISNRYKSDDSHLDQGQLADPDPLGIKPDHTTGLEVVGQLGQIRLGQDRDVKCSP